MSRTKCSVQFSSVQSLSRVRLFATPWIAARHASLSITSSRSSLTLTSNKSVMPSSHLILCHPLLLLPPIPPSVRVFSNESTLRMRWPKYWSFSFSSHSLDGASLLPILCTHVSRWGFLYWNTVFLCLGKRGMVPFIALWIGNWSG